MYYGNLSAPDMQFRGGVWDSTFNGVWHLNNSYADATPNANNGSTGGTMDSLGGIGHGRKFNVALQDSIRVNGLMGTPAQLTLSCWVNVDSLDGLACGGEMVSLGDNAALRIFRTTAGTRDSVEGFFHYGTGLNWYNLRGPGGTNQFIKGGWKHVVCTINPSKSAESLYVDGALVASGNYNQPISYTGLGSNTYFGKHGNGKPYFYFGGVLDEVRVENVVRSSAWTRLCYENQRQDSITSQVMSSVALTPVFNGTLSNKLLGFNDSSADMKIVHQGDNPAVDTLGHALMRFDLSRASKLQQQGFTLDTVSLNLYADSMNTALYEDSAYFGIVSTARLLPYARHGGYKPWTEDGLTNDSPLVIVGDTFYMYGISGQPDSSGNYAWVVYNFQSEIQRLGFVQVDSIRWTQGVGQGGSQLQALVKMSAVVTTPSEHAWETDSTGVVDWGITTGNAWKHFSITNQFISNVA